MKRLRDVRIAWEAPERPAPTVAIDAVHAAGECKACREGYCRARSAIRNAREALRNYGGSIVIRHAKRPGDYYEMLDVDSTGAQRLAAIRRIRAEIKRDRENARRPDRRAGVPPADGTVRINGERYPVRDMPGEWRDLLLAWPVGPLTRERHVAVEIECGIPRDGEDDLRDALIGAGLALEASPRDDGSVHVDGCVTVEIALRAPESRIADCVSRVAAVLARLGARVNKSCGLHVHIDCRTRDWTTVHARLYRAQTWLRAVVTDSRRAGGSLEGRTRYCKANTSPHPNTSDRYHAINACSYQRHRTIEVRLHHGTVDAFKINNWVRWKSVV